MGQTSFKQPNILFLLADDMGYGELGVYGQATIKTPNLDRLAAEGMRFTDFYAGCSVCSPSRASLMTGQHMGHVSIRGNRGNLGNGAWGRIPLKKTEVTLGEMLQQAGYETAFVGKWHLGVPENESTWAHGRGFGHAIQEQWGISKDGMVFDEKVHWFNGTQKSVRYDPEAHDCLDEFRTNFAMDYLKSRDTSKPFFLFMSYRSPHAHELYIREKDLYADRGWPPVERRHAARITMLDEQIQRLINHLEETGELDNTIILYTSDNGPHREKGHDNLFFKSAKGLRGYKRDLYEGGVRMPFIAYWRGKIQPGTVSNHIGAAYDFMPTLAALAGVDCPEQSDGISLLPELFGQEQPKHTALYWEIQQPEQAGEGFAQAVRMGRWKAVRVGAGTPIELYDLDTDLLEQNNIAAEHPEWVKRLTQQMNQASRATAHYPYSGPAKP